MTLIEVQLIHPIFVHFVIAPLVISIVFDFIWLVKKNEHFEKIAWYNLIVAGVFSIFSVISGLMAEEKAVFSDSSLTVFENHESLAFLLIVLLLIQFLWKFGLKGKIPVRYSSLYFLVALLCLVVVIVTSYFGGKLVFDHGIGVKQEIMADQNKQMPDPFKPKFQFINPDSSSN